MEVSSYIKDNTYNHFYVFWLLSTELSATSPLPPPFMPLLFTTAAQSEITEFSVSEGDLSVTFTGGLIKENTSTPDTNDTYWVVLPAGTTAEGVE